MKVQIIKQLICLRCNHKWNPRKEDVRMCPHCRSFYWDREKKVKNGKKRINAKLPKETV